MDASQANSMLNSFDAEMEDIELEVSHREGTQLITFILGSEKYGLKILKVRELMNLGLGMSFATHPLIKQNERVAHGLITARTLEF